MKNIPTPDSFISNQIGNNDQQYYKYEGNKHNQLETINDDAGSDFNTDKDFGEVDEDSHDFGQNLVKKRAQKAKMTEDEDSDNEMKNKTLHKQDTLGMNMIKE